MAQVDKCSRNAILYYCVIHKLGFHIHSFVLVEHLRLNLEIVCIISSSNVLGSVLDLFLDLYRSVCTFKGCSHHLTQFIYVPKCVAVVCYQNQMLSHIV